LEYLGAWRQRGYAIHTRGVVTCASAAALLLAFGDHGGRHIHRSTELLFHFSRVNLGSQFLTAARAAQLTMVLQRTDEDMLDALVDHVIGQDAHGGSLAVAEYRVKAYARRAKLATLRPGADNVAGSSYRKRLEQLGQLIGEPDAIEGLRHRLHTYLRSRFEDEQLMDHTEAYVLNLVDHVEGLTAGTKLSPNTLPCHA
jgi:hypothetical protein